MIQLTIRRLRTDTQVSVIDEETQVFWVFPRQRFHVFEHGYGAQFEVSK